MHSQTYVLNCVVALSGRALPDRCAHNQVKQGVKSRRGSTYWLCDLWQVPWLPGADVSLSEKRSQSLSPHGAGKNKQGNVEMPSTKHARTSHSLSVLHFTLIPDCWLMEKPALPCFFLDTVIKKPTTQKTKAFFWLLDTKQLYILFTTNTWSHTHQ